MGHSLMVETPLKGLQFQLIYICGQLSPYLDKPQILLFYRESEK